MKPFAVLLGGSWAPGKWADCSGFVTTRFVLAEDEASAAIIAQKRLLKEIPEKLPGCPPPVIEVEEVREAEMDQITDPPHSFVFYGDGG